MHVLFLRQKTGHCCRRGLGVWNQLEPNSFFIVRKCLITGGQGRNRTADASLFSLSVSCICKDLTGFRWLPKSFIRRQRHSNRGLESWAENVTRDVSRFATV